MFKITAVVAALSALAAATPQSHVAEPSWIVDSPVVSELASVLAPLETMGFTNGNDLYCYFATKSGALQSYESRVLAIETASANAGFFSSLSAYEATATSIEAVAPSITATIFTCGSKTYSIFPTTTNGVMENAISGASAGYGAVTLDGRLTLGLYAAAIAGIAGLAAFL